MSNLKYYTLAMLEESCRQQYPELPQQLIEEKAKNLKKALNTLDVYWFRSNRRFYGHNLLQDFSRIFN